MRRVFTRFPFESLLFSIMKGSVYASGITKIIPPPELYEHGSVRVVERDGIRYRLDPSCLMQWYVFWGFIEPARKRLYSLVKEGDIVLDVGTNIGETFLHFARCVGESGYVYGFEPDEVNFAGIQRNVELNGIGNGKVFCLGVSDRRETVRLFRVNPHNLGMNRILTENEGGEYDDFTTIETNMLDEVIAANDIERVDLIKIDIEGYEMHALRGALLLLRTFQPALFIEVGYSRLIEHGTSPNEMISLLQGFGYRVFHAETDEPIDEKYDFSPLGDGGIDVYAIAGDKQIER